MDIKKKTFDINTDSNGTISGYASTWIREPDSYGDVVAKGAFAESIEKIKAEGKILPLLFNHKGDDLCAFIGGVYELREDDHGLYFEATFDATPEAQRARELSMDGRLAKFSFAYDVLDQAEVTLEDGRKANELRKLNIHEVSLVLYPANPDTSVVSVKKEEPKREVCLGVVTIQMDDETKELIKAGRRNRKTDEDIIKQIISLANQLLTDEVDDTPEEEEAKAKSEELDTANDEEQMRKDLLEKAQKLLSEE